MIYGMYASLTNLPGFFLPFFFFNHQRQTFDPEIPIINVSYLVLSPVAFFFFHIFILAIHPSIHSVLQIPIIFLCPIGMNKKMIIKFI